MEGNFKVYNHQEDSFCKFSDIGEPVLQFFAFIIIIQFLISYAYIVCEKPSIGNVLILLFFVIILFYIVKRSVGLFKKAHIYYFALNKDDMTIEYSYDGKNRKSINIYYKDIESFVVTYDNVLYRRNSISSITANIRITDVYNNVIMIKSTGAIFKLIQFFCYNRKNIPNFERYTDSEYLQKYIDKYENKTP